MGWWLKNRVEIEIMVFLLIGVGLLTGVGSPTPWRGGGECLVTINRNQSFEHHMIGWHELHLAEAPAAWYANYINCANQANFQTTGEPHSVVSAKFDAVIGYASYTSRGLLSKHRGSWLWLMRSTRVPSDPTTSLEIPSLFHPD
jgi:hypothetical protein